MARQFAFDFLMARLPECIEALRHGDGRPEPAYALLSRMVPDLEFKVDYETFLRYFPILFALSQAVTREAEDLIEELSDDRPPEA